MVRAKSEVCCEREEGVGRSSRNFFSKQSGSFQFSAANVTELASRQLSEEDLSEELTVVGFHSLYMYITLSMRT